MIPKRKCNIYFRSLVYSVPLSFVPFYIHLKLMQIMLLSIVFIGSLQWIIQFVVFWLTFSVWCATDRFCMKVMNDKHCIETSWWGSCDDVFHCDIATVFHFASSFIYHCLPTGILLQFLQTIDASYFSIISSWRSYVLN